MKEIILFYEETKEPKEPVIACFRFIARLGVDTTIEDYAKDRRELERKVFELIDKNHGISVSNRIPFIDILDASLLEVRRESGRIDRYRPLEKTEIPNSIEHYLGKK
ncbi:hypothetical protein HYX19_04205 [Candidatus Woesearchaeota archaeon]|nr:hypothetical protein [Candidatus Woesearchaeota archaeon]